MPSIIIDNQSRPLARNPNGIDTVHDGASTPLGAGTTKYFETPIFDDTDSEALNVIIPVGGIGSRFQKEGYRFPKPLINIVGRPMICWLIERLSLKPQDTVWVAVNEVMDNDFQVGQLFKKWFPRDDIRLLRLSYLTKGATETLYIVSQSMPASHLNRKTVSLDCDTIYFADVLSQVRSMPKGYGGCFYFEDTGIEPIFSYIRTKTNDKQFEVIHDIQEKKAISNKANSGAYVFPSAKALNLSAIKLLDSKLDETDNKTGEYFTSQLIEMMIVSGDAPFLGIPISTDEFYCVGTPRQLRQFLQQITKGEVGSIQPKKQRFCFDLDMTLVGVPEVPGDYSTCPPIWRNIELVRALFNSGHHIIIQTARRMRTHHGNVGAVIADIGLTTFAQLQKYEIPYHEVFFGKPWAHIYVDDLAVNANLDTHRELGWIAEDDETGEAVLLSENKGAKKAGIVASRDFNHVQIVGDKVIKSSKSKGILGEMYFYTYLPAELMDLFPMVYSLSYVKETAMFSFTMQKLEGTTYSHMSVGRALTPGRFQFMLKALARIHLAQSSEHARIEVPAELAGIFKDTEAPKEQQQQQQQANIYANYSQKLRQRYAAFRADYDALGADETSKMMRILTTRLDSYEAEQRAIAVPVIHGDPVFSNAVLHEKGKQAFFFDMRCSLAGTLTPAGDVCYDLAKVLQSLQGYDHVILADDELLLKQRAGRDDAQQALDAIIRPEDRRLLAQLQTDVFWPFVAAQYEGKVRRQDLLDITASLLFSLLPLHKESVRPLFLKMCENIMEYGIACPNGC